MTIKTLLLALVLTFTFSCKCVEKGEKKEEVKSETTELYQSYIGKEVYYQEEFHKIIDFNENLKVFYINDENLSELSYDYVVNPVKN